MDADRKIRALEKKIAGVQKNFADYRALVAKKIEITQDTNDINDLAGDRPARDDDSHYFGSYEATGRYSHCILYFLLPLILLNRHTRSDDT